MNESENRLSNALRDLRGLAPDGAPPALGDMLKQEFQRHHIRRRRKRAAQISLLAACLAASVAFSFIRLRPRVSHVSTIREQPQVTPPPEPVTAKLTQPATSQITSKKVHGQIRTRPNPVTSADRFVALPTFDPAIPVDDLEMVRLNLPGRALRLVGYPVNEEFADRRVVADVLLAQDGTPYALRLVQSSEDKEQ